MTRIRTFLIRLFFTRRMLLAGLLGSSVISQALGISEVVRSVEQSLLLRSVLFGAVLGWGLAATPLRSRWAAPLIAAGVLATGLILVAGLSHELLTLLGQVLRWLVSLVRPEPGLALIQQALVETGKGLGLSVAVVFGRWWAWFLTLIYGAPSLDVVASALTWAILLSASAAWAAWFTFRHTQPITGMAPGVGLLAASLSYTTGQPYHLFGPTLFTLLMVVVVRQDQREQHWQRQGMDYSPEVVIDIWMAGTALAMALVFTGILIPSISVRRIWASAWGLGNDLAGESRRVAVALGIRESSRSGSDRAALFAPLRAGGLPRSHLVGSGPELSELPVLEIQVERLADSSGPEQQSPAVRYYWRGLTYDRYSGRGWESSPVQTLDYEAGEAALDLVLPGQRQIRQHVQVVSSSPGILYAAGTPVAADQPYSLAWRLPPDGAGLEDAQTGAAGDLFGASVRFAEYRVDSLVTVASAARLRATSGAYPDWLLQRYLALPEELPDRVVRLAHQLTAGEAHPYDQAKAIETYLRRIPYSLDLPAPPQNQDVVDYFLFELQRGYCDYYATAMVVLARASGLPSRLVMGYAQGTPDESGTRFFVSQANAHSWVEVYLPGWGWVEFEPTGGLPALERPASEPADLLPEPGPTAFTGFPGLQPRAWQRYARGFLFVAALSVSALWLVWRIDLWRLARLTPEGTLLGIQRRLRRHGRRLAVAELPGQTPYEYTGALLGSWLSIVRLPPESEVPRETGELLGWLVERYVLAVYSQRLITLSNQTKALQYWRRLQRRLWRAQARRLWLRITKER